MPREIPWSSKISEIGKNRLITYGIDQSKIIQEFSYEEMLYLLIFGKRPTTVEANMLRAVIVSHCSHGITGQSTMAVRMGADCRSSFLNSVLSGFLAGSGDYHQGALSCAMEMIKEASSVGDLEEYIAKRVEAKKTLYGFGHRFHPRDPRAITLMSLCDENNFLGKSVQTVRKIENIIGRQRGKFMNIEAAGGAILLDLGLSIEIAPLIIIVGRAPMFASAYMERLCSGAKPFQRLAIYDVVPGKVESK